MDVVAAAKPPPPPACGGKARVRRPRPAGFGGSGSYSAQLAADAAFLSSHPDVAVADAAGAANRKADVDVDVDVGHARAQQHQLHRTNLMNAECDQLLAESSLRVDLGLRVGPGGNLPGADGASSASTAAGGAPTGGVGCARWSRDAAGYVGRVASIVRSLGPASLRPEMARADGGGKQDGGDAGGDDGCHVRLRSDRYLRHVPVHTNSKGGRRKDWEVDFPGGEALECRVVGGGAGTDLGMTAAAADARVLPTIDLAVLIPPPSSSGGGGGGMLLPKDYLNYRYFDKRNLLALHVARSLSSKRHRGIVGSVRLVHHNGDTRRVDVLLAPPPPPPGARGGEKRKKKDEGDGRTRARPPRFRLRLVFGTDGPAFPHTRLLPDRANVHPHAYGTTPTEDDSESDDEEEEEEEEEESAPPTPHYNSALAEDGSYLATTELLRETASAVEEESVGGTGGAEGGSPFHRSVVLAKVWAAQRGYRHGQDSLGGGCGLALLVAYLYRTKRVSCRMHPLKVFAALMKLLAEVDLVGDDGDGADTGTGGSGGGGGVGRDTIRHARSVGYAGLGSLHRDARRGGRGVIVMPSRMGDRAAAAAKGGAATSSGPNGRRRRGGRSEPNDDDIVALHRLRSGCDVVFLDPTGTVNYLSRCSASAARELRDEARRSIDLLQGGGSGPVDDCGGGSSAAFRRLFLTPCRFWRRHDAYVHVPLPPPLRVAPSRRGRGSQRRRGGREESEWEARCRHLQTDLGEYEAFARAAVDLVAAALGDRAHAVRPLTCGNGELVGGRLVEPGGGGGENPSSSSEDLSKEEDADQAASWPARREHASGGDDGKLGRHKPRAAASHHRGTLEASGADGRVSCPLSWSSNVDDRERQAHAQQTIVLGIRVNDEAASRLVDRGPPANEVDSAATREFKSFWGSKAELRRFKDGAIVYAAVWNNQSGEGGGETTDDAKHSAINPMFCSNEISGGIVERIVRHILQTHLLIGGGDVGEQQQRATSRKIPDVATRDEIHFSARNILGLIENVDNLGSHSSTSIIKPDPSSPRSLGVSSSLEVHREILKVFERLAAFLIDGTKDDDDRLGDIPMAIDSVEPISPALRYSSLFPPHKHPSLGFRAPRGTGGGNKIPGAILSEPITIQLRLRKSNKWPTDIDAMGAAKCALLIRLAEGIEKEMGGGKGGGGDHRHVGSARCTVAPTYADVGFGGYLFRIMIRPDEELSLLKKLRKPTPAAVHLRKEFRRKHVVAAYHHTTIHAVHTRHPAAGATVRLATRWVASHMLSGMIPIEAIELLVARVFTEPSPCETPGTALTGFLRFLDLMASHDWVRYPLIVDPQKHLTTEDYLNIHADFDSIRGSNGDGPPMFIISPNDRFLDESDEGGDKHMWIPTFTQTDPERVVLSRAAALARRSYSFLLGGLMKRDVDSFGGIFCESSASLHSFSALLRVDPELVLDVGSSSLDGDFAVVTTKEGQIESPYARSSRKLHMGPKALRKRIYKNLPSTGGEEILYGWQPVTLLVEALRSKFGEYAVFFHNELAPDVIAMLWRPHTFSSQAFSAMNSEYKRPIEDCWQKDSLVITNAGDLLAEVKDVAKDVVVDVKVIDDRSVKPNRSGRKRKSPALESEDSDSSSDEQ